MTTLLVEFQILIAPCDGSASTLEIGIELISSDIFIAMPVNSLINFIVLVKPVGVITGTPFCFLGISLVHLDFERVC